MQKGGSFSKASFASADTEADISIDDPDFWAKWAKKAEIEEISHEQSLLVSEPRARKQIKRLGQTGMEAIGSDLDSDSDGSDEDGSGGGRRRRGDKDKKGRKRRRFDDDEDFMEDERDVSYGSWTKSELCRIEKATMQIFLD